MKSRKDNLSALKAGRDRAIQSLMSRALEYVPTDETKRQLKNNKHYRRAHRAFLCAGTLAAATPMFVAGLGLLLAPLSVMAQQPTGNFFGQDSNALGGMMNAAFMLFVGFLFIYGLYSLGMAWIDYRNDKPMQKGLIAGLGCLGFGAVCAAAWAIRNGQTPTTPREFDF